jgi:hypothetical protein
VVESEVVITDREEPVVDREGVIEDRERLWRTAKF